MRFVRQLSWYSLFAALLAASVACAPRERIKKNIPGHSPPPKQGSYLKKTRPYSINGITYYPLADAYGYEKTGVASWYGKKFHGRRTANGEVYDMYGVSAAHKTLPLGTVVEVTRLSTGRKIALRINDRGPFVADRIIDLSYGAAKRLGMVEDGTARVRVVALAKGRAPAGGGPPVPAQPVPDFTHGRFWVQVGAFGVRANAERVRDTLLFPRSRVRFQPTVADNGAQLLRVQVGPFGDMAAADRALAGAVEQGYGQSFIVAD